MAFRYPSWLNRNLIGFGVASFLGDISAEMVIVVLPVFLATFIEAYRIPVILGLMSGIPGVIASIVRLVSGVLSDRFKHKKYFIVAGYALDGIGIALIGTVAHIWQLLGVRIIGMMGQGMREPPRDSLISASVGRQYYGRAFGFHRAMDTIGAFIGPLLVGGMLGHIATQHLFFLAAGPSILAALVVALSTREESNTIGQANLSWNGFRGQLSALPFSFLLFFVIVSVFHCAYFNKMILILRVQELAQGKEHTLAYAIRLTSILYAFSNIVRACVEYGVGHLSDFIGRRGLLSVLGYALFGVIAMIVASSTLSFFSLVVVFLFMSISAGTVKVATRAYAAELLPAELRGTGFGMIQLVEGVGDFVSSLLVGLLWSAINPQVAFLYAGIVSLLAALLLLLAPRLVRQ